MKTEANIPQAEFSYSKPEQNENLMHRISLEADGKEIGYAELEYHSNPFAYYYVSYVFTKNEFRGQGFGSKIVDQINKFLDDRKKPGLLINAIDEENLARNIYENRGWRSVPNHPTWFTYNLRPDNPAIAAIYQLNRREDERFKSAEKEEAA